MHLHKRRSWLRLFADAYPDPASINPGLKHTPLKARVSYTENETVAGDGDIYRCGEDVVMIIAMIIVTRSV